MIETFGTVDLPALYQPNFSLPASFISPGLQRVPSRVLARASFVIAWSLPGPAPKIVKCRCARV
jgi:hypothetical protein